MNWLKIDRFIPVEEIRKSLTKCIGDKCDVNNIIDNYQATPEEEGFTASGALRIGVEEMTRFGFGKEEFDKLAEMMSDCILNGKYISEDVSKMRSQYREMRYCFTEKEFENALDSFGKKIGF